MGGTRLKYSVTRTVHQLCTLSASLVNIATVRTVSRMLLRRIVLSSSSWQTRSVHSGTDWVSLHGVNGSPYTKKVQTALRYKQIPFTFHQLMPNNFNGDWEDKGFGHIKPKVCDNNIRKRGYVTYISGHSRPQVFRRELCQ